MSKKTLLNLIGSGVVTLIAFGALFAFIANSDHLDTPTQFELAMSLLDEGRWEVAEGIARRLDHYELVGPEHDSAWHYVMGVSKIQSVQDAVDSAKNRRVVMAATEHLIQAEKSEFPIGYRAKGEYYLGWCYFHTYRWKDVVEQLEDSAMTWPAKRSDVFRMIIESQLRQQPPDLAAVRRSLQAWEAIPGMSESELARVDLAKAQLAFSEANYDQCHRLLEGLREGTPEFYDGLIWRGKSLLALASDAQEEPGSHDRWLQESEIAFKKVVVGADTPNDLRRQASYLFGRSLRAQGKLSEALGTFSGVRQLHPQSSEAIAAGIEEAEVLLQQGYFEDMVSTAHHVLRNIDDLKLYNEQWIPADELKTRLLDVGRSLRQQEEFDWAIELAKHIALAFPMSDSVRLQAETLEEWSETLAAQPVRHTDDAKASHRKAVEAKYFMAAAKFEELATLELLSSEYPDILWRSITNYQKANEIQKANELLEDYLRFEDRTKRPQGFLALSRNHMNSAQWQRALGYLQLCLIEYPKHPISYEARLLAAKARVELGEYEQAVELLDYNLFGGDLRPVSQVWLDSLFELGQTVYRQGSRLVLEAEKTRVSDWAESEEKLRESHDRFVIAIERLREAVLRFEEEDPRHYDARYLIAKSFRLSAEMPTQLAASVHSTIEPAKRQLMQQRRELLEKALAEFRTLHQDINTTRETSSWTERNQAIVRNCYFGEADTLYDLGRWEDAIDAYRSVGGRFLNKPESLEALVQMARCHRKLGQKYEASRALAQAEQLLTRIPSEYDPQFVSLTRSSREEWQDLIGWLRQWD